MKSSTIPVSGRRSMHSGFAAVSSSDVELSETDIDSRARLLLKEIDRVQQCDDSFVESSLLHNAVDQTYQVDDYLQALESEVDRLLLSQAKTKRHRNVINEANHSASQHGPWCRACDTDPCAWSLYRDADALAKRRKSLFREMKSADDRTKRDISEELNEIATTLQLTQIDRELHEAYAVDRNEAITIKSIHGFPVTLDRVDAIAALEHEHNRHVGSIVAKNVVDDILNWMLDGWYFGQYSQPTSSLANPPPSFVKRGSLLEKANDVQMHSNATAMNSLTLQEENRAKLVSMQTTTRYALFCITFSYFRALHLVRQQKEAFSLSGKPQKSNERMKMIQEHKNFVDRQQRIEYYYMRKARVGEERKKQRIELELSEKRRLSQFADMNRLAMNRLAAIAQRAYRGYLGRKKAKLQREWVCGQKRKEAFLNECATEIERAWRGYCGRCDAARMRKEMAEFLFIIREQEHVAEADEFDVHEADNDF